MSYQKLLIFFSLLALSLTNGAIIKVENKTHIFCIDDNDPAATIFIYPPLQKLQKSLDYFYFEPNDWDLVDTSKLGVAPITDKRWEDFQLEKTNYFKLDLNTSISISVYYSYNMEIIVYNDEMAINYKELFKNQKWNHYTILSKDGTAYIFKNDEIVLKEDFVPTGIVFRNEKSNYIKFGQDYKFWWSNEETINGDLTFVYIVPNKKSCIFLYSFLCNECYLEVNYNNVNITITSSKKQNNLLDCWKTDKIVLDSLYNSRITISKRKYDKDVIGYWALNFGPCDSNNVVTYQKGNRSIYACGLLNTNDENHNKQYKTCNPGKLGTDCHINCTSVLGQNFPYCEGHTICYRNLECYCAWGHSEYPYCKTCEEGTWGMNCAEICKDCKNCNKTTGVCLNIKNRGQKNSIFPITILLVASFTKIIEYKM